MSMNNILRRIVAAYPRLARPMHFAYTLVLQLKNLVLRPLVEYVGYQPHTLSDRGQDTWVLEIFDNKRNGFFLDIGAADGFSESNTYVLEKRYGWSGICVEPNPAFFALLDGRSHRTCTCVCQLIDEKEGKVEFLLSGQESRLLNLDTATSNKKGNIITMRACTLESLLNKCRAPTTIDYFSLDVEGAETRILDAFPFDKYKFLAITIERPTPELNSLLFKHGYVFIKNSLYDSFYVHESIPNLSRIPRQPFEQLPSKRF